MVFDTVYHEHVSYHALIPLEAFLQRCGLTIFDTERVETKGGSIRVFAQRLSSGRRAQTERYANEVSVEKTFKLGELSTYNEWFAKIETQKQATLAIVDSFRQQKKRVAAYGASTTTTTLLYHFELESRVDFIVDDNAVKQGMFSPGAHLPVYSSSELDRLRPDLIVILAWIYADVIVGKNERYLKQGGSFLKPLPVAEVVRA